MSKRGFTRVELLLVIGIIATLAAILFPVFAKARERARSVSCQANLFNIGMALRLYSQDHEGRYPPQHNVLDPLYPNYLPLGQSLVCPSGYSQAGGHLPPQAPGPAPAPSTGGGVSPSQSGSGFG
ncbi:MAG: type II secretion system protein [Armatimonadia bacterium]